MRYSLLPAAVLFRCLTAFQNFLALWGLIVLRNLHLASRSCETTLFLVCLYFSRSDFLFVLLARLKSKFLFLISCTRLLLSQGRLRRGGSTFWGMHCFIISTKRCCQLSQDRLMSSVISELHSVYSISSWALVQSAWLYIQTVLAVCSESVQVRDTFLLAHNTIEQLIILLLLVVLIISTFFFPLIWIGRRMCYIATT